MLKEKKVKLDMLLVNISCGTREIDGKNKTE